MAGKHRRTQHLRRTGQAAVTTRSDVLAVRYAWRAHDAAREADAAAALEAIRAEARRRYDTQEDAPDA